MIPPPPLKERLDFIASALLFLKEILPFHCTILLKRQRMEVVG